MGLALTACTTKNKNENKNENSMNTTFNLTQEWDKVFPKSDKVTHEKVTFKNHDMVCPKGCHLTYTKKVMPRHSLPQAGF